MKIWRIILIVVSITLLLAYLLAAIIFVTPRTENRICSDLKVNVLDVEKLRFVTTQEIVTLLENNRIKYKGLSFAEIDLHAVEKAVKKHPMIKFVSCYQTPSGILNVDVKQRQPLFRMLTDRNNFYVDEDRLRMPVSTKYAVYVPIVTGYVNEDFIRNELFDFIVSLQDDDFWSSQITQIHVYPNFDVELTPRVGSHIIYLGSVNNAQRKLDKLLTFYKKGLPRLGWNRYTHIDLRYRDQVVCVKPKFTPEVEIQKEN
ncbi:MAG TPA: cell division protein FtsQ [Paludibacteraceae bacterium]|nr:cell division protein FtsQ [Paludibacteraceae bacterium]HQB68519.1 cell division protein FtsQ [Paludibacteraceae bacterium]HRS67020.1 cell division protein FtsQ [Paludibacteraceae bacterium]